ncbi:nucleotide exchange factor GrpE, partial [Paraburkholderia sp. SIMBA_054]
MAFKSLPTFSDMENTQENPTSQNPTPADETERPAAEAATPEQEAAASVATDTP